MEGPSFVPENEQVMHAQEQPSSPVTSSTGTETSANTTPEYIKTWETNPMNEFVLGVMDTFDDPDYRFAYASAFVPRILGNPAQYEHRDILKARCTQQEIPYKDPILWH